MRTYSVQGQRAVQFFVPCLFAALSEPRTDSAYCSIAWCGSSRIGIWPRRPRSIPGTTRRKPLRGSPTTAPVPGPRRRIG